QDLLSCVFRASLNSSTNAVAFGNIASNTFCRAYGSFFKYGAARLNSGVAYRARFPKKPLPL
ncbi:hypothetical protein, partial [Bradyrhizobium sp. 33ap4]|uniref:hypothetical protein n=1 Tax=Bradyrhizobium sp. 33ap4 TaxID=3061630 RepID=UPI00292D2D48